MTDGRNTAAQAQWLRFYGLPVRSN